MTEARDSALLRLRRKAVTRTIETVLRSVSGSMKLHPAANPERHGIELIENLSYGPGGEAHALDIYRPYFGERPLPVVLYFHGGGFSILSKDTHWMMGLGFSRAGYLVVNANYRLAPKHTYPAALEDAALALEWVWDHIEEYGGDPDRVVLAGESAGGNLATALTIACTFERPEPFAKRLFERERVPVATVPLCAMLEVSNAERYLRNEDLPVWVRDRVYSVCNGYLGEYGKKDLEERGLADPLRILESDAEPIRPLPPFWASCGDADPIVDDTKRLDAVLDAREVECRVGYYWNEGHAFQALPYKPSARHSMNACLAFLGDVVPEASG
jgi:acetyl esterase